MLATPDALEQVVFGPQGLAGALGAVGFELANRLSPPTATEAPGESDPLAAFATATVRLPWSDP